MADIIGKITEAAKNIDKKEVKEAIGKALDSKAADKVIDAAEEKLHKDINKSDIKEGLDKLLK